MIPESEKEKSITVRLTGGQILTYAGEYQYRISPQDAPGFLKLYKGRETILIALSTVALVTMTL